MFQEKYFKKEMEEMNEIFKIISYYQNKQKNIYTKKITEDTILIIFINFTQNWKNANYFGNKNPNHIPHT